MKKWKLKRTEKLIKNQNQESFWIEIPSLNYESKDETLDKRCQHYFQVQARPTKLSWSELIYYLMRCPKSTYQACASIRIKWSATKIFGNFLLDSMPPQTMRSCLKLTVILVLVISKHVSSWCSDRALFALKPIFWVMCFQVQFKIVRIGGLVSTLVTEVNTFFMLCFNMAISPPLCDPPEIALVARISLLVMNFFSVSP